MAFDEGLDLLVGLERFSHRSHVGKGKETNNTGPGKDVFVHKQQLYMLLTPAVNRARSSKEVDLHHFLLPERAIPPWSSSRQAYLSINVHLTM